MLQEFKAISDVLAQIIPWQRYRAFGHDLKVLLADCICLWDRAKKVSCIIEFDTNLLKSVVQAGFQSCPKIDSLDSSTKQGQDINMSAWCLLPHITFKPVSAEQTIVGSAIFIDSQALQEGLNKLQCQEEEIAQARQKFVHQRSISKRKKTSWWLDFVLANCISHSTFLVKKIGNSICFQVHHSLARVSSLAFP